MYFTIILIIILLIILGLCVSFRIFEPTYCIVLYYDGVASLVIIYMSIEVCPFFVANCVIQAGMFEIHARHDFIPARNAASNISIGATWCIDGLFLIITVCAANIVKYWLIELRSHRNCIEYGVDKFELFESVTKIHNSWRFGYC